MRKESSNEFTEGLVCDLNPINTPNTVLTDALNATIITYDGNEYSLQNDRGNYPLEHCKLKPNYIPVGLKEYGDILYIVSYNPLNNHVEVGSYPSPMEVIDSKNGDTSIEIQSVFDKAANGAKYSDLVEECEMKIWTSNNEEDSKLYPGDKYRIQESNKSTFNYEQLEYYIIDEDRKKHNISNLIKFDDFYNVSWQVPGWLATQYRLATFDDFTMSIRSIEAPSLSLDETIDCKIKLNFQFRISDKLFLPSTINNEDSIKSDIGIRVEIKNSTGTNKIEDILLNSGKFIDWYSDSKILWIDFSTDISNLKLGDTLIIKATPFVKTSKTIWYDSFVEERTVFLNSVGSYNDFKIGSELWKFYIDDVDTELYLEYDVSGPYVTTSEVYLYYRILELEGRELQPWKTIENYAGITNQGVGIIPFENEFNKEGIYVIEFAFYKQGATTEDLSKIKTTKKLIVASKIFSNFVGDYTDFSQIDFDIWINKYKDSIKSKNWTIDYTKTNSSDYSNFKYDSDLVLNGKVPETDDLKNLWNQNYLGDNKGLLSNDEWSNIKNRKEQFVKGIKYTANIKLNPSFELLEGKLWDNTPGITIETHSYVDDEIKDVNRSSLKNDSLEAMIQIVLGETMEVSYRSDEKFEFLNNIKELSMEDVPVMHVYFEGADYNMNDYITYKYWSLGKLSKPIYSSTYTGSQMEGYQNIPNNLSKAINGMLGTQQFGVLLTTICLDEKISGRMEYRHNKTVLWDDHNGSSTYLFSYLVFRQSTSTNNIVLVRIDDNSLWNIYVGPANMEKLTSSSADFNVLEVLQAKIQSFCNGVKLCTKNSSVQTGNVVHIQYGEPKPLPIYGVNVYTKSFTSWIYETSVGNYNLLSSHVRNTLMRNLSEEVCGKLLSGTTQEIKSINFFSKAFENTEESSDPLNFSDLKNKIDKNNGRIEAKKDDTGLLSSVKRMGANTKGVYWVGGAEPTKLIELLHSRYSSNNSEYLTADGTLEDVNIYLTNDEDGIVFARVNTNVVL